MSTVSGLLDEIKTKCPEQSGDIDRLISNIDDTILSKSIKNKSKSDKTLKKPKLQKPIKEPKLKKPVKEPNYDDYDLSDTAKFIGDYIVWRGSKVLNWLITVFIQIPIDIMSWDMESLSIDFGYKWGDPKNIFRGGCERFINGSYAGDFSLYEGEKIEKYLRESHSTNNINDEYKYSPEEYLCTHGNNCMEISDVFGKTMLGRNGSLTKDNSPTNGYMNGINITSSPRKYVTCCSGVDIVNCNQRCSEESPLDISFLLHPSAAGLGFGGSISEIAENAYNIIRHPINYIDEIFTVLSGSLGTLERDIRDCTERKVYNFWNDLSDEYYIVPDPNKHGFSDWGRKCPNGFHNLIDEIEREYEKRLEECHNTCETENNQKLIIHGCNSDNINKANRAILRNRNDTLLSQLPRDYKENIIKKKAIKKEPWKPGERPLNINPDVEYNRGQQKIITDNLTTDNGTLCTRYDLTESELDNCFGPFRPMTSKEYPVLFYKITKDFMGSILWTLFGIFLLFIILYILCLFNPIGRAAYKLNSNAGIVESGIKNFNIDKIIK
tara:strand:+ start:14 stop:1669 length:1656 start_codon:yes stop_codon:yes gene_type:complete